MFACIAHPNVKLFITHGGFHSVEEAVYNAKPLVGIPFFADQVSNMRRVEKSGYGKQINLHDINEESFESVVKEVISNPRYAYAIYHSSLAYMRVLSWAFKRFKFYDK